MHIYITYRYLKKAKQEEIKIKIRNNYQEHGFTKMKISNHQESNAQFAGTHSIGNFHPRRFDRTYIRTELQINVPHSS